MSDSSNETGNVPVTQKKPSKPAASKQSRRSKPQNKKQQSSSQEKGSFASRRVWPD